MKLLGWIFLAFLSVSCSSFYEFSNQSNEKEMFRTFQIQVGKDTLDFNAYKDYYFDTVNLEVVYIQPKELKKLKNSTLKYRKNRQILFLHNDTPYYLNIIGFYYPNSNLNQVNKPDFAYKTIPLHTGIGYQFIHNEKPIADFYIPYTKVASVIPPKKNSAKRKNLGFIVLFVKLLINFASPINQRCNLSY